VFEIGFPVTADAQRHYVVEKVSVLARVVVRIDKPPNGNDVMYVRVASDFVARRATTAAFVVVTLQRPLADGVPARAIRTVPTSLPVRMSGARERLREPLTTAVLTTDGYGTDVTGISLDGSATNDAIDFAFSAVPAWIVCLCCDM
jgi:hypothetical protein